MDHATLPNGTVYTETVVFSPPARYKDEAPYQIAIVDLDADRRMTVRIAESNGGGRVQIGDVVRFVQWKDDVAYFQKADAI